MKNRLQIFVRKVAAVSARLALLPAAHTAVTCGTITFRETPAPEYTETLTTHCYLVGPQSGFADVVVSLKDIHGKSRGVEAKPLVIEQKGREYIAAKAVS